MNKRPQHQKTFEGVTYVARKAAEAWNCTGCAHEVNSPECDAMGYCSGGFRKDGMDVVWVRKGAKQ